MARILLAAWFGSFLLTLSGFCWTEPGWKSNRELIEAAFRHEIEGGWSNMPDVDDISAYLADYPRCCSVSGSGTFVETPILNALFLRRFYAVSIMYPVVDPAENQGVPFYESILIMDCCGKDIPDSYGMASSDPPLMGPLPERGSRTLGSAY